MSEDIGLGNAQMQRRVPKPETEAEMKARLRAEIEAEMRADSAESIDSRHASGTEPVEAPPSLGMPANLTGSAVEPDRPANPYAPVGWQKQRRIEFDFELPSGQVCRLTRLEREDLIRLNLMEYLNTFAPMLLDQSKGEAEQRAEMEAVVKEHPESISQLFTAVDKVVMACTLRPKITDDPKKINYGTERDWANPNFTATVPLDNIDMMERIYIFGAAFGKSMDDLKSLWGETEGMDGLADVPGVQHDPQQAVWG